MEGGLRQLLAAQEADKENQALKTSQPIPPPCQTTLWPLHFRFFSLRSPKTSSQPLRFRPPRPQHHSGNITTTFMFSLPSYVCVYRFIIASHDFG